MIAILCSLFLGCADAVTPLEYELVASYPHNSGNFTQGLMFYDGNLYEGTGQYGDSRLIRYRNDFETPALTRALPNRYFGEGIAVHQNRLYQLTWKSQTAFAYDPADLSKQGEFSYEGEGWGITSDGDNLWMSNGSSDLLNISTTGEVLRRVAVTFNGEPLNFLNELDWVEGYLVANRWYDNQIYFIDTKDGEVEAYLNLEELALPQQQNRDRVLNGIAWNPERSTLWITGKYWDSLYELKLNSLPDLD